MTTSATVTSISSASTSSKRETKAVRHAKMIVERYRGMPGEEDLLFGVLLMTHSWDVSDAVYHNKHFVDTTVIAARIDEIRKES